MILPALSAGLTSDSPATTPGSPLVSPGSGGCVGGQAIVPAHGSPAPALGLRKTFCYLLSAMGLSLLLTCRGNWHG
jgi:hypothetical protein